MNIIGILMALTLRLAYISLPLYLLKLMSDRSPITRYYFRLGVYVSAMGLCSIWGVIVSIAMTLMGKRQDINFIISRTFYAVISKVMGITCTVDGEHHLDTRPAVLVGNHQSMLDIVFLGRCDAPLSTPCWHFH
jgi:lysophosphatidate acyltransferase